MKTFELTPGRIKRRLDSLALIFNEGQVIFWNEKPIKDNSTPENYYFIEFDTEKSKGLRYFFDADNLDNF